MTPGDTARLLALAAAFDKRTVGQADVEAWHLVIGDLNPRDCAQAIREHFTETTDYLMPKHVIDRVKVITDRRAGQQRALELEQQRAAEQRAIEVAPVEPVDRKALAAQLAAAAARGPRLGKATDPRRDKAAMERARAEVARVRVLPDPERHERPRPGQQTPGTLEAHT